ncbi:hypothetical protein WJX82_001595 [Trebouxia sp. C0006]
MQSCQPHTQRHGSRIGVLPPPAVHQVNRVPFVCVHHKRRRLHAVATKLQVATLQTDERTDNAGSEWEVEWFDEAAEAADLKPATLQNKLPAEVRYFDTAQIFVRGGDGGKGCVAFRREKYVPKGGPAGGNGGSGGNVWVQADDSLNSLTTFRKQVHYRADNGRPGGGSNMTGANAEDLIIKVPPGTVIRAKGAAEEEVPLAEVVHSGDRALLMTGGRGGRGNASFKSGWNKAPQIADLGEEGRESWLELELKLVADVGIIGVPNAGKSTLLSVITAAKPKVADYPFTTLVPNLGVCEMNYRTTVFADIPGLLEGAHAGRGLGHEFLRHCQRARILVHVIDGSSPDPVGDYAAIQTELQLFAEDLASKPQIVAYNKMDVPDSSDYWQDIKHSLEAAGVPSEHMCAMSAVTGQGVIDLVKLVHTALDQLPAEEIATTAAVNRTELPKRHSEARIDEFSIDFELESGQRVFTVTGEAIERFAQMTNWDYYEAANRFQKVLEAAGINKALKKEGVTEGDTVLIGEAELAWSHNQSEAALYEAWLSDRKAKGKVGQGQARWPHQGGG